MEKKPEILNGINYEIIERKENGHITAKCQHCKESIGANKGVTSNFFTHLKRKHPSVYESYQNAKKAKSLGGAQPIDEFAKNSSKYTLRKRCTQAEATKVISEMIVDSGLPLTLTERKSFRKMVQTLSGGDCHSISRKTLKKEVDKSYVQHSENIKEALKGVEFFCTTADIWSTRTRSFMGMTLHYIDPNTFERKSHAIACERFKGT